MALTFFSDTSKISSILISHFHLVVFVVGDGSCLLVDNVFITTFSQSRVSQVLLLGPVVLQVLQVEIIATCLMAHTRSVGVCFLLSYTFVLQSIKVLLSFS